MIRALKLRPLHLLLILAMGGAAGGCTNGEPNPGDLFKSNLPPIANAGPDQTVLSGASVLLDGSASSDPNGKTFHYEWRIAETPRGSSAQLDTPTSAATRFTADVDGVYRIELRIIEDTDPTLPTNAPIADTGAVSAPDEVMVIAGPPGPFPDSGNKLVLDGSHFALSTTILDIGDPLPVPPATQLSPGTQLNEMTAEGWFFFAAPPPSGPEALVMRKQDFFEVVLNASSQLFFRIISRDGQHDLTVGPAPVSIGQWHHVAVAVAGKSNPRRAYLAIDGAVAAADNFTGLLKNNANRLTIGGGEGRAFMVGMAEEVRITQDVRYPEGSFAPPKEILIPDSPFVSGARFSVHGLWHFDEPAGAQLFTDFSFRRNDLFLVGNTGFQPFGRLQAPRRFHTAVRLEDQSLWVAGGVDDAARTVTQTEIVGTNDQLKPGAPLNIIKITGEAFGTGDGSKTAFDKATAFSPIVSDPDIRVVITAGSVTATDNGLGGFNIGGGIASGSTIKYDTGEIHLVFTTAPAAGTPITITYLHDRQTGVFLHTATKLKSPDARVLVAGGEDKDSKLVSRGLLYDPAETKFVTQTAPLIIPRRYHTAGLLPDGKVILIGGESESGGGTVPIVVSTQRSTELFDPNTGLFASGGALLVEARKLHRMIALKDCNSSAPDGQFLIVGGYDNNNRPLKTAEIFSYNGSSGGFSPTAGAMEVGRVRHAVVCLPGGKVLITGGIDLNGKILDTAEVFDPGADPRNGRFTFLQAGLNVPRAEHAATLLSNGNVLITGGFDRSGNGLTSAELYDPGQNLFVPLASAMGIGRFGHLALPWHSAVVGKDGVLLIGGGDETGIPTSLVEIFYP